MTHERSHVEKQKRWHCRVCGLPLGIVRDRDLYPMLGGWRADMRGVLHITCPKCKAERQWPESAACANVLLSR